MYPSFSTSILYPLGSYAHLAASRGAGMKNLGISLLVMTCVTTGCSDSGRKTKVEKPAPPPAKAPQSEPSEPEPSAVASQPTTRPQPQEKPPQIPKTRELPESRYDSKPPYPVELHVRSPKDPQPGWLRVIELGTDKASADVDGKFPEQNLMIVDTTNVLRIEVNIGHLPLAERKRIMLRLDGQTIELMRGKRQFVTLKRQPTGAWNVESSR